MQSIEFYKMEGAGNDFVVIDNRNNGFTLDEIVTFSPKLCHRRFGVGADGVLVLEKPQIPDVNYTLIYRNADGSDAGMCGNGARCMAFFASKNGFPSSQIFNVHNVIYSATILGDENIEISFPDVSSPKNISFDGFALVKVHTGTEHVVEFTDTAKLEDEDALVKEGRTIRLHPKLNPPGTNVNFVCINNNENIDLQTYERGVENLTLACGTGALASAIATHFKKQSKSTDSKVTINVKGGTLVASFHFDPAAKTYTNIKLSGPAHIVYKGNIEI